ncbi:uncharacterized protein C8Q71DRAFT_289959 [Rhodofomes roseus]|uniref:Secreted protein n=1 Tax=Rhodofomes roseus TaxID=34475 RepID=A0ABQ8K3V5_9APHY|nr:uncharacterized protein C8Q71DRAFT_289959 [Rhodofomes roseus]KAH9831533.1 hypothetical protein C8Q71DRAFT_289959 [Rhodofomes roseus]
MPLFVAHGGPVAFVYLCISQAVSTHVVVVVQSSVVSLLHTKLAIPHAASRPLRFSGAPLGNSDPCVWSCVLDRKTHWDRAQGWTVRTSCACIEAQGSAQAYI